MRKIFFEEQFATQLDRLQLEKVSTIENIVLDFDETVQEIVQEMNPDAERNNFNISDAFHEINSITEYLAAILFKKKPAVIRNLKIIVAALHKMPKIKLVEFDGKDFSLYPLFYENFKQFVHSKIEYIQYLLCYLSKKLLKICSSIESIPDNYDII